MNGKQFLVVAMSAVVLLTVMFIPISSQQDIREYDPWYDMNDDGKIDIWDLAAMAKRYGALGTPINKTALLLNINATYTELLSRINSLNETIIYLNNTGMLGRPADYDSGWRTIPAGSGISSTHNLNTTELFVYLIGKYWSGHDWIHQYCFGGDSRYLNGGEQGVWWVASNTTINLYRAASDNLSNYPWEYVRAMLWKIPQP